MDSRHLRRALNALPRSELLFKLARLYVNFYEGQDDPDFRTNGEERTLRAILPGCRVVVDVGAHVGDWTAMALEIEPSLEVHCFEPSASSFAQLRARHGSRSNVRLNQAGLGTEVGSAELHLVPGQSDISSVYPEDATTGSEEIALRTVDEYCADESVERIDYLKVDTEGHELAVLRGAERMIREGRVHYLQLEYGPRWLDADATLRGAMELLERYGYQAHKILPSGPAPATSYAPRLENFTLSNWLFARGELPS